MSPWLGFCLPTCLWEPACVSGALHRSALCSTQISPFCVSRGQRLTVCQCLLHRAGPAVSHCSRFPQPPLLLDVAWGCSANGCWREVTCIRPRSSPMLLPFSGSLMTLWATLKATCWRWRNCHQSGRSNNQTLLLHYYTYKRRTAVVLESVYSGSICHLSLGPTDTLSGHFGHPKPTFCDTDDLSEANHCACIQLGKPEMWRKHPGKDRREEAPARLCHWYLLRWMLQ